MKINRFFLFIAVFICSFLTMSFIGNFYSDHISTLSGWFWGPDPKKLTGFILSFLFFGSLLSRIFIKEKKSKIWMWYVLPFLIFLLGSPEEFIIGLGIVVISLILAQGILFIYQRLRKSSPVVEENN
jgi:hypothetical protein